MLSPVNRMITPVNQKFSLLYNLLLFSFSSSVPCDIGTSEQCIQVRVDQADGRMRKYQVCTSFDILFYRLNPRYHDNDRSPAILPYFPYQSAQFPVISSHKHQYCVIYRYGMEFFKCIQINGRTFPLIL